MPENEETQQDVAKASDKLSCRTRLMGPLLILGGLVALEQPKSDRKIPLPRNGRCPPGYHRTIRHPNVPNSETICERYGMLPTVVADESA